MAQTICFTTSHHQFYINDAESPADMGSATFWTDDAFEARLAVATGILGVDTASYGEIALEIATLDAAPAVEELDKFDHVVEAGIQLPSGQLQITNCPFSEVVFETKLPKAHYRVRLSYAGLGSQLDEDENADDRYLIEVWPDPKDERIILKKYAR
ncbi:MAG TPA: hypothetical protein VK183_08335 [Flavobacterium sp.]|nr:hypothetical protein [Flavobacterium sp.]